MILLAAEETVFQQMFTPKPCLPNKAPEPAVSVAGGFRRPHGQEGGLGIGSGDHTLDLPCPPQPRIFCPSSALGHTPFLFPLIVKRTEGTVL